MRLTLARELYAEAYEPFRTAKTLEALERQHSLRGAADALERGLAQYTTGLATESPAVRVSRMELAGLEPATSWVRSRRSPS